MKNKKTIRFGIAILFAIIIMTNISAYMYYEVKVKYDRGDIKIDSVNIFFTLDRLTNLYNEDLNNRYSILLKDKDNVNLDTEMFTVPNRVWYDEFNETGQRMVSGGSYEVNETEFTLYIPYNEKSKKIVINNKENTPLDEILVSEYSKQGFDINEFKKNIVNASVDKNIDQDIIKNKDSLVKENNYLNLIYIIIIIIIIIIILIIIIIFVIIYKRKKK